MGLPLWHATQLCAEAWRRMGATARMCRSIQFGIYESHIRPFVEDQGVELGDIPQTVVDRQLGMEYIKKGCPEEIY